MEWVEAVEAAQDGAVIQGPKSLQITYCDNIYNKKHDNVGCITYRCTKHRSGCTSVIQVFPDRELVEQNEHNHLPVVNEKIVKIRKTHAKQAKKEAKRLEQSKREAAEAQHKMDIEARQKRDERKKEIVDNILADIRKRLVNETVIQL